MLFLTTILLLAVTPATAQRARDAAGPGEGGETEQHETRLVTGPVSSDNQDRAIAPLRRIFPSDDEIGRTSLATAPHFAGVAADRTRDLDVHEKRAIYPSLLGDVQEAWVARHNGPGNSDDLPFAHDVDDSGNVYVTGGSTGSGTGFDYSTVKYNAAGVQEWTARYNGPANGVDGAVAVAVDASGNVYVTGQSQSTDGFGSDYATIKYSPTGIEEWVARYDGPINDDDLALALAIDNAGNTYVTGMSIGDNGTFYDYATIKYDAQGQEEWVARFDGGGFNADQAHAIAVDALGNVYVTGNGSSQSDGFDYLTIKYTSTGIEEWVARYNGPGGPMANNDAARFISIDAMGSVYVTGESEGQGTGNDYATIKYDSMGNQVWVARYDGPANGLDLASALRVESDSGSVFVAGSSEGLGTTFDYATIKYSSTGNEEWVARYNGTENGQDVCNRIALDDSGNVYVTGRTQTGTVDQADYATVKYSATGAEEWVAQYNGPGDGNDIATAIAVDSSGFVYVTGLSEGTGTSLDYATIKYEQDSAEGPIADVSPNEFTFVVPAGSGDTRTLNMGNLGNADLVWDIAEVEGVQRSGAGTIADGSFEEGTPNPSWAEGSTNFGTPLCTVTSCGDGGGSGPHSGSWWAWFGGVTGAFEAGFVAQDVTIPTADGAELRFWLEIPAAGTTGFLEVSLGGDLLFRATDADAGEFPAYAEVIVDVTAYADGGARELRFESETEAGMAGTNFFVDDVSLVLDGGEGGNCDSPLDVPWLSATPISGTTLPGGSVPVDVAVDTTDLTAGQHTASLCVTTNDPNEPLVEIPVDLTVEEGGGPVLAFDPPSLDFGAVAVGSTSPPQIATLHNTGDAAATGVSLTLSGDDFLADTMACTDVLDAGQSCPINVTFGPQESGQAAASLMVGSDQGASDSLDLAGQGVGDSDFTPVTLEADPDAFLSDGNGVLEPGELAYAAPAWRNDTSVEVSLTGMASNFTGPSGGVYYLGLDGADYGIVAPTEVASCLDTGLCYFLGVNRPATRPALHWETGFDETLSNGTSLTWSLHVGDSFVDVPRQSPFYRWVETLLHHGVTGGCTATEYCPGEANTRGQMAVFLLKAAEDGNYVPPACIEAEERFTDVSADSPLCPWIEALADNGVTSGCGGDNYCPADSVTRAQMAVFLLRALEGEDFTPPPCTGMFSDVDCPSTFAAWVEELAVRGIASGCDNGSSSYCPGTPVTRAQMAVLVSKTFELTLYGP